VAPVCCQAINSMASADAYACGSPTCLERAGRCQPANGRLAHAIGPGQIGLHSAFRESLDGLLALMGGQLHTGRPNRTPRAFAPLRPSPDLTNAASQAEDFPMSLLHSTCCRAATPNGPSNDRWARDCFDALENGEIKVLREIE
jgi:hypothetical protein